MLVCVNEVIIVGLCKRLSDFVLSSARCISSPLASHHSIALCLESAALSRGLFTSAQLREALESAAWHPAEQCALWLLSVNIIVSAAYTPNSVSVGNSQENRRPLVTGVGLHAYSLFTRLV